MGSASLNSCKECLSVERSSPVNNITIGDLADQDEPEADYAYPEHVKYQVACTVNHVLSEIPEINLEGVERGKKFNNSYFLENYNVYYTGEWKNGRPHGLGDVVFQNGAVLKGTFVKGAAQGSDCIFVMDDGSYYRGNIQNNAFNGRGIFVENNGHSFEGNWQNNLPNGQGIQKWGNGDYFQGTYVDGKKKGEKGLYSWRSDHPQYVEYIGGFDDDYMSGMGKLVRKNGTQITGVFRNFDIEDAFVKNSTYQYQGTVKNGLIQGKGKIKFLKKNNMTFEGNFLEGNPHGEGTVTYPDGKTKSGTWFQGTLVKAYTGFQDKQMQRLIQGVELVLQKKDNFEELLKTLNSELRNQKLVAEITEADRNSRISSNKYLIANLGNKDLVIKQTN